MPKLPKTAPFMIIAEIRRMMPDWDDKAIYKLLHQAARNEFTDLTVINVDTIVSRHKGNYDELIQELAHLA